MLNLADATSAETNYIIQPANGDWLSFLSGDLTTAPSPLDGGSAVRPGADPATIGAQVVRCVWDLSVAARQMTDDELVVVIAGGLVGDDVHEDARLIAALNDLKELADEALEEGFPVPSDAAIDNARRLLEHVFDVLPRRYEIYPTPDAEVAIDAPGGSGASVIVLCESDGAALCLVNIGGRQRRARYSTVETLPDGFVREALVELEEFGSRPR